MTEAEPMKTRGNEFILSKVFEAHKQDVKCVISTASGGLITGSRDETVKVWAERAGRYEEMIEIKQRNKLAVNSIAFYQAKDGQWLLFAGLKDGSIEVFNAGASEPTVTLYEHTSNVCVLYVDVANKLLLSGSWDSRAIVWSIDDIVHGRDEIKRSELTRHTHSVWAISSIPTNPIHYLTGSADRKIKLHNSELQEIFTFEGHTDVVRSVCALSETIFVSAANDSTLRVWDVDTGKCIQKCETTHGEYIYSICKLGSKTGQEFMIAGGEKGYCEIYSIQEKRQLHYVQQIRVPVQSIWSVAASRSTDIVMATSTGSVYIFTVDKDRSASEDLLQAFDAEFAVLLAKEVENQKESESVTIKVSLDDNAPNLDLKYVKGTDPAVCAEKFIKDNRLPMSYLNEITEYIKTHVPEAQLAEAAKYRRQETQRETIDGELFDYALEVKLKENGPQMKLGYNIGEDPDYATQRFVEKHSLPVGVMGQLSAFLRSQIPELQTSSQFVRIGGGAVKTGYVDPFTGGGRYVPGGIPGNDASPAATGDPLTGGNRYVPGSQAPLMPNSSVPRDKKRPRNELVPLREFYRFGLEGVASKTIPKLREMNDLQPDELKLDESQINALNKIMTEPVYEVTDLHVASLESGLKWSIETIVPVLDIFRVALLNAELNKIFCSCESANGEHPKGADTVQRLSLLLISEPSDPVRILVCRALANACVHRPGRVMLNNEISEISKIVVNQFEQPKQTVQVAAASALANFALLLLKQTESGSVTELGPREDVLRAVINTTERVISFSDHSPIALTRILQSVATLMWGDSSVINLAKNREMASIINRIKDSVTEESSKNIARDCVEMIHAV